MQWFLKAVRQYADFNGRARRTEYWFYILFYILFAIALSFVDAALTAGVLSTLYALALMVPSLAVLVRRLHDTDRSGWWILIGFVPVIGLLVLLVFACMDSSPGDNRFGPSPKAA